MTRIKKMVSKCQQTKIPLELRKLLEDKLLPLGGSWVSWHEEDPDIAEIADRGQLFLQPVQMRLGEPRQPHRNSAKLWANAMDRYKLVSGYALSKDEWVGHSWVVDEKNIYETTNRHDRYFGIVLGTMTSLRFWIENVYYSHYPDDNPPDNFWDDHMNILELMHEIGPLTCEKIERLIMAESQGLCD